MKYMDIPQLNQLSRLLSYESSECNVHTRIECYSMKPVTKDKRLWKALEKEYVEDQMEVNQALFGKDAPLPQMNQGNSRNASRERRSRSIDISANSGLGRRSVSFNSYPTNPASIGNSPLDPSNLRHQFSPTDDETDDRELASPLYRLPGQLDKSERKTLFVLKSTLNAAFPHHDFAVLGADQFSREKNASAVLGSLSNTFRSVGVSSPSLENGRGAGGRSAGAGGRGGGSAVGVTTYSAYPGEGGMFRSGSVPTRSEGIDVLRQLERNQTSKGEYDPEIVAATHPVLFGILDDAIGMKKESVEVYVWTPSDVEMDPHHAGGGGVGDSEGSESSSTDEEEDSEGFVDVEGGETESEEDSERGYYSPGGVSIRKPPSMSYGRFSGIHQTGSFPTPRELEKRSSGFPRDSYGSHGTRLGFGQTHSLSPTRGNRLRLKGSLLWSNHWFFVNRKQKRVLFISIWAKSRGHGFSPSSSNRAAGDAINSFSSANRTASFGSSSNRTGGMKHGAAHRDARGVGHGGGLGTGENPLTNDAGIGERFVGWQGAHGAGARAFAARAGSSLF